MAPFFAPPLLVDLRAGALRAEARVVPPFFALLFFAAAFLAGAFLAEVFLAEVFLAGAFAALFLAAVALLADGAAALGADWVSFFTGAADLDAFFAPDTPDDELTLPFPAAAAALFAS